jgi:hypothetical protein
VSQGAGELPVLYVPVPAPLTKGAAGVADGCGPQRQEAAV